MPGDQLSLADESADYREFVEKFKPKKTTDDCYTPECVYQVVKTWACERYEIDPEKVARPFWPGADYQQYDYGDQCVIDNPPFSILASIVRYYNAKGIRFFLFSPYLTNFSTRECQHIVTDADVRYENGAYVNTSFITNMEEEFEVLSAPDLNAAIIEANRKNRAEERTELPKYTYPDSVLTATMVGRFAKYGVDFKLRKSDCVRISELDAQKVQGKSIFGSGYLLSEEAEKAKAAAEIAANEEMERRRLETITTSGVRTIDGKIVWELSERERIIQTMIGGRK